MVWWLIMPSDSERDDAITQLHKARAALMTHPDDEQDRRLDSMQAEIDRLRRPQLPNNQTIRNSNADAEVIAQHVIARLIDAMTDQATVDRVTSAWSGSLDKMIGRGIRKLAAAVVLALILFGAVKFEILGTFFGGLKQ